VRQALRILKLFKVRRKTAAAFAATAPAGPRLHDACQARGIADFTGKRTLPLKRYLRFFDGSQSSISMHHLNQVLASLTTVPAGQ
jgi:hypothetical protein